MMPTRLSLKALDARLNEQAKQIEGLSRWRDKLETRPAFVLRNAPGVIAPFETPTAYSTPIGQTGAATPPLPAPADWAAGQMVRHKRIPGMVPVPILEVFGSLIRLVMQDNGEPKETRDDWQNYDNLTLAEVAKSS